MAKAKAASKYTVDFSKDTSDGGRSRFPEGDYRVKFTGHKTGESKDKGTPYIQLALEITEGKYKGQKVNERLYNTDGALWRIRTFLEAMGVEVPRKKIGITWSKYYGNELGVTLGDNEYNGRISSRVSDFIDLETLAGTDVDEDEDEDEEDSNGDLSDMDRDELKAYIKENKLDIKVKKTMDEEALVAAIQEAEGDEDDDEDEDEDLEDFDADEDL